MRLAHLEHITTQYFPRRFPISSIWTDLLFLHGHLVRYDLAWRADASPHEHEADLAAKLTKGHAEPARRP
jgi:hypothetical protein